MPFTKGIKKIAGRKKGTSNVVTRDIKEAFKNLLEMNLENMTEWLQRIALKNPDTAFDLMLKLAEYNIPKLSRSELTGKEGNDLGITINRTVVSKKV